MRLFLKLANSCQSDSTSLTKVAFALVRVVVLALSALLAVARFAVASMNWASELIWSSISVLVLLA